MSYDPRWGDDPRDRDYSGRDLSRGGRGGSDPRERERVEPRDVSWTASASHAASNGSTLVYAIAITPARF